MSILDTPEAIDEQLRSTSYAHRKRSVEKETVKQIGKAESSLEGSYDWLTRMSILDYESPVESTDDLTMEIQHLTCEVQHLRETLSESTGTGLMRSSLLCAVAFLVCYAVTDLTPLTLVHPVLSIGGFVGSIAFFTIGFNNSKIWAA